jgi:oxygen-independent coproporphyrinogen-3 oxidase
VVDCLGVYLHIPFCQTKCHYCDFVSGPFPEKWISPYVEALKKEIQQTDQVLRRVQIDRALVTPAIVDSIYFGGGTPSTIEACQISEINRVVRTVFNVSAEVEVTLEVNPGSVDSEKVRQYKEAGINRVSIGIQAFQDHLLEKMGRSHSVEEGIAAIDLFRRAGFCNISIDIIAGLPGQSPNDWQDTLRMIHLLAPEHISMYLLELHPCTVFGQLYSQSGSATGPVARSCTVPELPGEELVVQCYTEAIQQFIALGYLHYEISNFAKPGRESRHNLKYWTDQPFLGFGCSAFSYLEGRRWGNERSLRRYIERINRDYHAVDCLYQLSEQEVQEEAIFLGLRVMGGLDIRDFKARFGFDFYERFSAPIAQLREGGLVECNSERVRLTPSGCLLSNEVFTEFLS